MALFHFESGVWQRTASPVDDVQDEGLGPMWGSGTNDVWVAGQKVGPTTNGSTPIRAVLLHWDGNLWQFVSSDTFDEDGQIIEDLWGTSPRDVWAAGGNAVSGRAKLWHYDGTEWTETVFANPVQGYFLSLWGSCPSDYWAYGPTLSGEINKLWHYDGSSWSPVGQPISVYAAGGMITVQPEGRMTGTGPDDLWVVASGGRTCRRASTPLVLHRQPNRCGDGTVAAGEECDPPRRGPDGLQCDDTCHLVRCGNGVVDPGEDCDPPVTGRCDTSCHHPICGNGVVDPGEDCEPPRTSTCDASCRSIPIVCGNGIQQPGESCDFPDTDMCRGCTITCCGSCFYAHLSSSSDCPEVCSALGGTDRADCQSLLSCMLAGMSRCTVGGNGALGCYCSDQTCSAGANGPCVPQIQTVARTSDLAEIRRQLGDSTTTLGGIAGEAVGFGNSPCGQACTMGVRICGYP